MTKKRNPIPKKQKEISKELTSNNSIGNNPNTEINRGNQNSFKGDDVKPFSIGLEDIDNSILYYFNEVIKPSIIQNGNKINIPIIYSSPEKWKSYQKDGYYRDQNGKIMAPLISFKRDGFNRNRSLANKLDANKPYNFGIFTKKFSAKNAYDQFSVLNNRIPEKTYYVSVVPDYIDIEYSCVIFTYRIDQLNKIIEAINYASDSYWGDPERFKFQARIDSFNNTQEVSDGDNRVIKSSFTIKLSGYIIPDTIQKDLTAIKKFRDKSKIIFQLETTENLLSEIKSPKPVSFLEEHIPAPIITSSNCDPVELIIYLQGGGVTSSFISSGGTYIIPRFLLEFSGSIKGYGDIFNPTYSLEGTQIINTLSNILGSASEGDVFIVPDSLLVNSISTEIDSIPAATTYSIENIRIDISGSTSYSINLPYYPSSSQPVYIITGSGGANAYIYNSDFSYTSSITPGTSQSIPDSRVENLQGSYTASFPSTNTFYIPNTIVSNSVGTLIEIPSCITTLISNITINSSFNEWNTSWPAFEDYTVADVEIAFSGSSSIFREYLASGSGLGPVYTIFPSYIFNSISSSLLYSLYPNQSKSLERVEIKYNNITNTTSSWGNFPILNISGGFFILSSSHLIPTFSVFSSASVIYSQKDISDPNIVIPTQSVTNSLGSIVDTFFLGEIGYAPNAYISNSNGSWEDIIPSNTSYSIEDFIISYEKGEEIEEIRIPYKPLGKYTVPVTHLKNSNNTWFKNIVSATTYSIGNININYAISGGLSGSANSYPYTDVGFYTIPVSWVANSQSLWTRSFQSATTLSLENVRINISASTSYSIDVAYYPSSSQPVATINLTSSYITASGIVYSFGYILASGQTASYRTGDEGTMRNNGFFNYTRPSYPINYAELSQSSFVSLSFNNLWGNRLRFTNRSGGAAANSGNRIIQDHLTGIEWYIFGTLPGVTAWNTAIDDAVAFTTESLTGWYIPNDRVLDTITRDDITSGLNYSPFLITTPLWTSTTRPDDSNIARVFRPDIGSIMGNLIKTSNTICTYIYCRKFI